MAKRTCKYPGCPGTHKAYGWCKTHYRRWKQYGDPAGQPPEPDLPGEHWEPLPGSDGAYLISDLARARSYKTASMPGRLLKHSVGSTGYPRVSISLNGKSGPVAIHVLVALTFLGPPGPGEEVRHKDGNRLNGVLANLEYGTPSDNAHDKKRHGTDHNANKTHCPHGHEYTPENTYINPTSGGRQCRTCRLGKIPGTHVHARKTHCPQGHPYDEENTYIRPSGSRECRICLRDHQRHLRERRRSRENVAA